jgi:hypothetical protein
MKNFAYWLANALEWSEARKVEPMEADYSSTLIGRYQVEMLSGTWSQDQDPLSAQTVNAYVNTFLEYLLWAADKGFRKQPVVPTVRRTYVSGSYKNSRSNEVKTVESRKGKVKVSKKSLAFPSDTTIEAWRKSIYAAPVLGQTQGLMVDHLLGSAIRREELACWRVDTLPLNQRDWKIVNPDSPEDNQMVSVTLRYGCKGRELYRDHGDKVSGDQDIKISLSLARRIHEYRENARPRALLQQTKGVRDKKKLREILDESVHLYLNPKTGRRYTGDQIYRFWKSGDGPAHWSPHLGRDWWACTALESATKQQEDLLNQIMTMRCDNQDVGEDHPLMQMLSHVARSTIQLVIKPQLRHVSEDTTENYLVWLSNKFQMPVEMTKRWLLQEEDQENQELGLNESQKSE